MSRSPTSKSWLAKPHGRIAVVMLLVKAALAMTFALLSVFNTWVVIVVLNIAGVVWFWSHFYYLPFYNQRMNCLQGAMAACFAWANLSLVSAQLLSTPEHAGEQNKKSPRKPLNFHRLHIVERLAICGFHWLPPSCHEGPAVLGGRGVVKSLLGRDQGKPAHPERSLATDIVPNRQES